MDSIHFIPFTPGAEEGPNRRQERNGRGGPRGVRPPNRFDPIRQDQRIRMDTDGHVQLQYLQSMMGSSPACVRLAQDEPQDEQILSCW